MDMEVEVIGNHQERLRVVDQEEEREDRLGVPIVRCKRTTISVVAQLLEQP